MLDFSWSPELVSCPRSQWGLPVICQQVIDWCGHLPILFWLFSAACLVAIFQELAALRPPRLNAMTAWGLTLPFLWSQTSLLWATTAAREGRIVFVSPDCRMYRETPWDHKWERCFDFQTFLIDLACVKLRARICREPVWSSFVTRLLYCAGFRGPARPQQQALPKNLDRREFVIQREGKK